jgi:hypothetical protein
MATTTRTTRKPAAKKATAKKPVAKKPVTKKPVTKKPVAKKAATKKPVAKKIVAKKPAAKKATKPAARKPAAKLVRHGAKSRTTTAKRAATRSGLGVDRDTLLRNLVKLSKSKQDAVALEATKALLPYVTR